MREQCQIAQGVSGGAMTLECSELRRLIDQADAVSFDFFDTLFVRPLADPEDAFELIERKHNVADFPRLRRAAQMEAFRHMQAADRKEITLEDIYACLRGPDLPAKTLMQAEYDLELALVEPNVELFELFRNVVASGKPVVITSDMYLPAAFFAEVLRPHGLDHVPLYISCERNATKRDSGELFDVVVRELGLPASSVLHIGDNELGDVLRPRERGLQAYHYRPSRSSSVKLVKALSSSLAHGMLSTCSRSIPTASYTELGFCYGGPAMLGFLEWIKERTRIDAIDHILFLARDGYGLERIASKQMKDQLPSFSYFLGSRTAYTLAAMDETNFSQFLPFLLSGSDGLSPCELLERIGVRPPASEVMEDLGLGCQTRIGPGNYERLASFLYAFRWEILKVCQRNRRALNQYLREVGLSAGARVALVDVGWSGTTQEAFELAIRPLMKLDVFGYYFCLADTSDRRRREQSHRMTAMVTADTTSPQTVGRLYGSRVAVELFFSAPHHSVIGLEQGPKGIRAIEDAGRGASEGLLDASCQIVAGIEAFAEHYLSLKSRLCFTLSPLQTALPLIQLAIEEDHKGSELLASIRNFDAWGSSRNHGFAISDYKQ
ncbi:hypothetical protein D9M68_459080 [compost metagenome]